MIPGNELRIGNYVLAGQTVQCISMIDGASSTTTVVLQEPTEDETKTVTSYSFDNLQPVLLNDGVLQQCQFVYHDYFKFWQLLDGREENRSEMNIDRDYNILDFMRKPIVKNVASLHQLQNIYFLLKGKELVIHNPS